MSAKLDSGNLVGFLVAFAVSGYLQFRAVRDFRTELVRARKTGKIRGLMVGVAGIVMFFGFMQIVLLLALFQINHPPGEGPIFMLLIVLIVTGFVIGPRQIGKIRNKKIRSSQQEH